MQQGISFITDDSETGRLVSQVDWGSSPLGPMDAWPQSLKTSLSICLACRFPIIVWWGPDMVMLYNDDYIPVLGNKHPSAMGGAGRDVWADVWPVVGPMLDDVVRTGKAAKAEDLLLLMRRNGYLEETYFSFSYSPILDESGGVGGIFTPVIETTETVIGQRRVDTLRKLGSQPRGDDLAAACHAACNVLAEAAADVPFGMLYAVEEDGRSVRLLSAFGVDRHPALAPARIALDDAAPWPVGAVLEERRIRIAPVPAGPDGSAPLGAWEKPVQQAKVIPIALPGTEAPVAIVVAAVSPHRPLDAAYSSFYRLLADQMQRTISEALSLEAERQRMTALAELDAAKTTFFSNVSHELRTPLTLMLGPIEELLADAGLPAAARGQILLLQRNGLRLLKLVNALLDFSRIEAGRMRASFEPLDLAAYTTELANIFRSVVERAALVLDIDCRALPQPVYIDRGMWEKIVLNLLSNAFKFTLEGRITVRLRHAHDRATLQVSDTGVGIEAGQLPHVFERFRRIEGTQARTHEGTGIGLALVRDLVSLHGGDIRIESTPGAGTAVTVALPYGADHLPPEQVTEAPTRPPRALRGDAYTAEPETWLAPVREDSIAPAGASAALAYVVDDNADMRSYITELLAPHYTVRQFANGAAALAAASKQVPDVVVSDVMMPVLNGYELLDAMRKDPQLHAVPVLLLSARAGEDARVSGIEAGADDYLEKPFSRRELVAKVDHLLLRARVRTMESEQASYIQSIFEQAPVAIAILRGPQHVYELANPLYRQLVDRPNPIGKPVREVLPELEEQGIVGLLDEVYRSGEPYLGRSMRVDLKRGGVPLAREGYFDFVFQPLRRADGSVEGIAVVAYEVSEAIMARQAAEVASRAKDEFMAMLGHELRNPLAPIMTALQLMKLRNVREGENERAIIERQAQHLVGLVDDLLDVARVARGKVELRKEPLELATIVTSAVETASPLLEERQHLLQIDVPPRGLVVSADRHRLGQVIGNLLTNAAKYSDNGSRITVKGWRNDGEIVLEVKDTGNGIPADMLPHIFEMFYQDRQTLARARGGLGLGLTIVRSLIELHGGAVSAFSEGPGMGSAFTVRLPAYEGLVEQPAAVNSPHFRPRDAAVVQPLSILVVDDNVDAARTLQDLLQSMGHRVSIAFDGPSGLRALQASIPDVAILDIGLPGMDGYELARRIKAMAGTADMRLVALTGYGQDIDRMRTAAAGFHLHAVKPLTFEKLEQLLEAVARASS
ncbi:response regulator [Oxalobacteraceae bacterium OM1]|nr:response regulator [Oxalobacteraceae bacterium OM1]